MKNLIHFIKKAKSLILFKAISFFRNQKYNLLSDIRTCSGNPKKIQPLLITGSGTVKFGKSVIIGTRKSPYALTGYAYIQARNINTCIIIDDRVWTNNNLAIICEGPGVKIGEDTLIGSNVEIYDSDFHPASPLERKIGSAKTGKVIIGKNVWIGSNVKILKGVEIGDNSIIANNSVVTKKIPSNVIAGGIPAKTLKIIENDKVNI